MSAPPRAPLIGVDGQPLLDSRGAVLYGATSPGGIPYPSPTDPVAQGAANMQAIATFLDPSTARAYRTAAQNVPPSSWTPINTFTGSKLKGTGLTVVGDGIQVNRACEVRCQCVTTFIANTGGARRAATMSLSSAAPMGDGPNGIAAMTTSSHMVSTTWTFSAAAGNIIYMLCYQDSTSTLTVSNSYLAAYISGGLT